LAFAVVTVTLKKTLEKNLIRKKKNRHGPFVRSAITVKFQPAASGGFPERLG
jgi:hypothetical protein